MRAAALALALMLAPAVAAQEAPSVPVYGFEVVRVWPHDRTAFTQGLVWHDGALLESTGRYPSTVRRVRLEDGEVLDLRTLDTAYFGEGLTELDGRVFTVTWQNGVGFIWDAANLSLRGRFTYPGEGWGLTDDNERLILSDGTPVLRFLDPASQTETGRVAVTLHGQPVSQINELEWVEGEVFANVWQTDWILRIDPDSGRVTGVIDLNDLMPDRSGLELTDAVLNGIAWDPDGRRLFVTGKNWPSLFEIRLTGPHAVIPAPSP